MNVGAQALAAICKEIEATGRAGITDDLSAKIDRAGAEYEKVRTMLEKVLKGTHY